MSFAFLILRPTFVYFPDILVSGWTNPIWQFEATWIIRPKLKGVNMLKNIFEASPPSQKHPKRVNFFGVFLLREEPTSRSGVWIGLPYPNTQGSRCIDLHLPPKLPKCWFSYTINSASGLGFLPGRRLYLREKPWHLNFWEISMKAFFEPLKKRSLKVPWLNWRWTGGEGFHHNLGCS